MKRKFFVDKNLTQEQLKNLIRTTATKQGVKRVIFSDKAKKVRGTYNAFTGCMFLCTNQSKKDLLETFFHELGHHTAVKQNKWKKYHFCLCKYITLDNMFYIENKIDQIGQTYWNKMVDIKQWGRYNYCYPKSKKSQIIKQLTNS